MLHLDPIPPNIIIDNNQTIKDLDSPDHSNKNLTNKSKIKSDFIKENIERDLEKISINNIEKKIKINKKFGKRTELNHKKNFQIKNKRKFNDDKNIFNSINLMGVLKIMKDFQSKMKYLLFYKNYNNLSQKHHKIINDLADFPNNNNNFDFSNPKKLEISQQIAKYLSINNIKIIFLKIISNIINFYNKIFFVINPDNKIIFYWNILNLLCLLWIFVIVPLEISFIALFSVQIKTILLIIKQISCIIFLIDILLRLNLGYYDETGEKVMICKKIFLKYVNKYLLFDLLFYLSCFIKIKENSDSLNYLSFFSFFKFFHLKKILNSFEEKLCLSDFYEGIFLLIKLVLKILFIAHMIACFFHIVGVLSIENNLKSWIYILDKEKLDKWEYRYIYSIYWAVATVITVGYGDITPQNQYEVIFLVFIILIGCGTFAYGINSIGNILSNMSVKEKNYFAEQKILNRFMKKNNFNNDLQCRVRKYFQFVKKEEDEEEIEKENSIISKLSLTLQNEIILNTNGFILKKMKFFSKNFSEEFLHKLVTRLKKRRFLPEEHIFLENDTEFDNSLYYIMRGQVEIYLNCNKNEENTKLDILESGETFNEVSFISDSIPKFSAKSINYTTIFYINRKEFINLLKEFTFEYEKFCMIREKIIFSNDFQDLKIICKLCNKNNHYINDCPSISISKNIYKIIKIHQNSYKFQELKRRKFNRRKINNFKKNSLFYKKEIESKMRNFIFKNFSNISYYYDNDTIINQLTLENNLTNSMNSKNDFLHSEKFLEKQKSNTSINQIINEENINYDEYKEYNNENLNNKIQYEIISDSQISKINEKKNFFTNIFSFNFDHFHNYEYYLPKFNYDKVINKLKLKFEINKKKITLNSPGLESKKENNNKIMKNPVRKSFFKEEEADKSYYSRNSQSPQSSKKKNKN